MLGVTPEASPSEIKKAYRKLALKYHPDRGGDAKKFQELTLAMEVLSDPEKRRHYDLFGTSEARTDSSGNVQGLFQQMDSFLGLFRDTIGRMGYQQTARSATQPEAILVSVPVTLEELFHGVTKHVTVQRMRSCSGCSGTGSRDRDWKQTCSACRGTGVQVITRACSPGYIQQVRATCPQCQGSGRYLPAELHCKACQGHGALRHLAQLSLEIGPGCSVGQAFCLHGEGHQLPGQESGDVICVLQEIKHQRFRRLGNDLVVSVQVPLVDSLTGEPLHFEHLDSRTLLLRPPDGHVLKPDSWHLVRGEGMPLPSHHADAVQRGDLYVHVEVLFPDQLPKGTVEALRQALSSGYKATPKRGELVEKEMEASTGPGHSWHSSRL